MKRTRFLLPVLLLCAAAAPAIAQDGPPAVPVNAATRHAVIDGLSAQLRANYVFPDLAARIGAALKAKEAAGGYASDADSETFAAALTGDLRSFGHDLHFVVHYAPGITAPTQPETSTAAQIEQIRPDVVSHGFGIERVQRLPGNVGYLQIRAFGPTELVANAITAAMTLLSGTDALILDLRHNGGGEPATVAYLLSHFFAPGDDRHLNDIYTRQGNKTRQYWTSPAVMPRYTKPIYVLTSARTFSGAEECAYDLQTQKRATLVGEVTGGGANPGDGYPIGRGFAAFIPNGRAINPVTHTNWEHVGVKPDLPVPAAEAETTAYVAILHQLIAKATDPDNKAELQDALATAQSKTAPPAEQ